MENKHTVSNPLKLTWNGSEYKVNKPNQDTQELVSKSVAEELLHQLISCTLQIEYLHGKFGETGSGNSVLSRAKDAIGKNL